MNFQERMKAAARKNAAGVKKDKWCNITVSMRQEDYDAISRISHATGETLTTVMREFVESNRQRLSRLANELEKGAPAKERVPTMAQVREFTKTKKGAKK